MTGPPRVMPAGSLYMYEDPIQLSKAAAELLIAIAASAIQERGTFCVALSGGSTPRKMYEILAEPTCRTRVDWEQTQWFWGDERYVLPDAPESNYRMAAEALLKHVPVPAANVHRFQTEINPPAMAAEAYEDTIRKQLGTDRPRFDLIYLGLGSDGHTASLFPKSTAMHERTRSVVADILPGTGTWRLSFTFPLINHARCVAFVVSGQEKASVVRDVLLGPRDPDRLPAQMVTPDGELRWLVDRAAAALLSEDHAPKIPIA